MKKTKNLKLFAMILFTSALLIAAISPSIAHVKAAEQATVNVIPPLEGGTTDPSGSGNLYDDGATVNLAATPDDGYIFLFWTVSTDQYNIQLDTNPAPLIVSGGVTYNISVNFLPVQPVPDQTMPAVITNAAIVFVVGGVGGTTSPAPGSYALANAAQTTLTATPDSGWQFSHWIISGPTDTTHGGVPFTLTPTDNPYTVGHGYGYTYYYQPVFIPTGTMEPTPNPTQSTPTPAPMIAGLSTDSVIIIVLVVIIVILLIAFAFFAMRKSNKDTATTK